MSDLEDHRAATLLVLGASGDLAARLLLPGLAQLLVSERYAAAEGPALVGAGVEDLDDAQFRARIRASTAQLEVLAAETLARATDGHPGLDGDALRALLAQSPAAQQAQPALLAEFALAQWLTRGLDRHDEGMVAEAEAMLAELECDVRAAQEAAARLAEADAAADAAEDARDAAEDAREAAAERNADPETGPLPAVEVVRPINGGPGRP